MAPLSRRAFVRAGLLVGAAFAKTGERSFGQAPAVITGSVKPGVIAAYFSIAIG